MFKKKFDYKEVECPYCHQKIKPQIKLNRVKSEFINARYTRKDKAYCIICTKFKKVIGIK